jgi:hypothetical protein
VFNPAELSRLTPTANPANSSPGSLTKAPDLGTAVRIAIISTEPRVLAARAEATRAGPSAAIAKIALPSGWISKGIELAAF